MILIDFYPGSLGHLLLRTIKYHWPTVFGSIPKSKKDSDTNHDIHPDLFLSNHSNITDEQMHKFCSLTSQPSIVLTHNRQLLPKEVLDNWCTCSITCNNLELATATFLYWYKSGVWHFDFIADNNRDLDFYQACWLQFLRILTVHRPISTKFCIEFTDMNNPQAVHRLLNNLQSELELPVFKFDAEWYSENYTRSIDSITIDAHLYHEFCGLCQSLLEYSEIDPSKEINTQLTPDQLCIFKNSMNFFKSNAIAIKR